MLFEYGHEKSQANLKKHGIDFKQAANLWDDEYRYVIQANSSSEPRFIMIAQYRDKHWSAIFTYRRKDIRIISVRRSRKQEVTHYEQAKKDIEN